MRSDEKLTSYEAFCVFCVTFLHHQFNEVLPLLVSDAGPSAWISQILGGLLAGGFFWLFLKLMYRYKGMDLLEIVDKTYGKAVGKLVQLFLLAYLMAYCAGSLNQVVEVLQIYAYSDVTSMRLDLLLVCAASVFLLYSVKGLSKTISIFLPVILFALVTVLLLCFRQYDSSLLSPALGYGVFSTARSGAFLASQYTGVFTVSIFAGAFSGPDHYKKSAKRALLFSSPLLVATTLCYNLAVPYPNAKNALIGIMGVAQDNHNSRFLQRLESVFIIITVMEFLLLIGIGFLAMQKVLCHMFSIPSTLKGALIVPVGLLQICIVRTLGNLQGVKMQLRSVVRRYSVFYLTAFLLLTLLVGFLRGQGRRKLLRRSAAAMAVCLALGVLSGCASYREPDSEIYPIMLGYDKGETEKYRFTMKFMQLGKTAGGSSEEKGGQESGGEEEIPPDLMVLEAPSFVEGINMINALMPKRVSLLHVKMIVISEELAKEGVEDFVIPMSRYNDVKNSVSFVVSKSSAYEFVASEKATLTDSLQLDMEMIMETDKESTPYLIVSLSQFLKQYNSPYGDAAATLGNVNQAEYKDKKKDGESPAEKIAHTDARFEEGFTAGDLPIIGHSEMELAGMAVFSHDKMVGVLNTNECQTMAFLTDAFRTTLMTIPDPNEPEEDFVSLRIRRSKPVRFKSWIDEEDVAHIQIHVSVNGTIEVTQNPDSEFIQDPAQRAELKQYTAKIMEERSRDLIEKLQREYRADILQLGRRVAKNFLTIQEWEAYQWRNRYPDAQIDVSYQINL